MKSNLRQHSMLQLNPYIHTI